MASKFRALEAGGLPYATIPSHYFIRSFSNTLTCTARVLSIAVPLSFLSLTLSDSYLAILGR